MQVVVIAPQGPARQAPTQARRLWIAEYHQLHVTYAEATIARWQVTIDLAFTLE
jgi:hypothetical protein